MARRRGDEGETEETRRRRRGYKVKEARTCAQIVCAMPMMTSDTSCSIDDISFRKDMSEKPVLVTSRKAQ